MADAKTVRLDVTKAQVNKLRLGQKVRVTLVGVVRKLEAADKVELFGSKEPPETFPPNVDLTISSVKIVTQNEFEELAEE